MFMVTMVLVAFTVNQIVCAQIPTAWIVVPTSGIWNSATVPSHSQKKVGSNVAGIPTDIPHEAVTFISVEPSSSSWLWSSYDN